MAKKNFNPFYALLIVVGVAFCITAFAYGIMTLRGLQPADSLGGSESGKQLMHWIDQHGFALLMGELAALAVLTFSAIATDEYWTKRENAARLNTETGVADKEN